MKALLWTPLAENKVRCDLCAQACIIADGSAGICAVRVNREGILYSLVSEGVRVANVDPIEKKPLYHYLPQSLTFSIGTEGCNLSCLFCQNAELAHGARQHPPSYTPASPTAIVKAARESGCSSIAFTYNEPTVFYELLRSTSELALEAGLGTVLVSNGYQSSSCIEALGPLVQAANIDLKSMREAMYRDVCKAHLKPVLRNIVHMARLGWWLELTTLVIEGLNDSQEELDDIASFIATELGPDVPWHVSAFYPCYQMQDKPPTSLATLKKALEAGARKGLHFVYTGNNPATVHTLCPKCGAIFIPRHGSLGIAGKLSPTVADGLCGACGETIAGRWKI